MNEHVKTAASVPDDHLPSVCNDGIDVIEAEAKIGVIQPTIAEPGQLT